jgi:hypothetical protein
VLVAVLDTGVDLDHPDLFDHIWTNPEEIDGDGIDNDRNGFVDDMHGWDFIDGDAVPEPVLGEGFDQGAVSHGTLIAGIIGAVGNNAEGIAGINWEVTILPIRTLDRFGSGDSSHARRAVDYAIEAGADVINLSFTGFDIDTSFLQSIENAHALGITVVAAVGNDENGGLNLNEVPIYPACFEGDDGADLVIGVAGVDEEDRKTDFSNFGSECTDISAPGEGVFGTMYQEDDEADVSDYYGGYWSGTSVAAPMIAGASALLKAAHPSLRPPQVLTILQLSADPILERDTPAAGELGAGRINIARALEIAPLFAGESTAVEESVVAQPSGVVAVAAAYGSPPTVRLYDSAGNPRASFDAYAPEFAGGVRVAVGDVDGDGEDEIITGAGPGGGPHIRVFETDGALVGQFFAYNRDTRHGVFVATGDLDSDGVEEIIVSPDAGGNGEVRVFDLDGEQRFFFRPFDATAQSIRVTAGNVTGDERDEIITGLGPGGRPRVRVFEPGGSFLIEFDAYAATYNRGIFVDAGDIDGDGEDEIVTGTDIGGGPHVRVFDGGGRVKGSFFAYDEAFRGGVRVAVGDSDQDGVAEIWTGAGPGGGSHVRAFLVSGSPAFPGFFANGPEPGPGLFLGIW